MKFQVSFQVVLFGKFWLFLKILHFQKCNLLSSFVSKFVLLNFIHKSKLSSDFGIIEIISFYISKVRAGVETWLNVAMCMYKQYLSKYTPVPLKTENQRFPRTGSSCWMIYMPWNILRKIWESTPFIIAFKNAVV